MAILGGRKQKLDQATLIKNATSKKKKESKTLGLTDSQIDTILMALIAIMASWYVYTYVDWEYTIWPRSLSGVVRVEGGLGSSGAGKTIESWTSANRSETTKLWWDAVERGVVPKSRVTLVKFSGDLIDILPQLLPVSVEGENNQTIAASSLPSVLDFVHAGIVSRIIWFRADFAHFFVSNTSWQSPLATFYVGKTSDGILKITNADDYFVLRGLYAPLESLAEPKPVELQVLPFSELYRRRTDVAVTQDVLLDIDSSYFLKLDPISHHLRQLGLDAENSRALRALGANLCLDQDDINNKVQQVNILQGIFKAIFERDMRRVPKDVFLTRVRPTFASICGNKYNQEAVWTNFQQAVSSLNDTQWQYIKAHGLPAAAGTTAVPTDSQVKRAGGLLTTIIKKGGLPTPCLTTVTANPTAVGIAVDTAAGSVKDAFGVEPKSV